MKRILKEPLLHFLLLGAAIFALHSRTSQRAGAGPGKIVINRGQIENIAAGFARTWQRAPTSDELAGLVRDRVREEVYCREAVALGLDKDDTVIRRRLRQKMEFVSDDIAAQTDPTDADLTNYLQAHPDRFRVEQNLTFRQIYLDPQKHGEHLQRDAAALLGSLNQSDANAPAGDAFLLEGEFDSVPLGKLAKQFGEEFAAKLATLQLGQWLGPIESGYGVHLVKITARTDGRLPALADVRDAVRREWDNAGRLEANEKFYQELRERYEVVIEQPKPADDGKKMAQAP